MQEISRRHTLLLASASAAVLLSAGCASLTGSSTLNATLAKVSDDVSAIAGGLASVLPQIAGVIGVPPDTITKVSSAVADLKVLASQVSSASSATSAQPLIKQVEADVNAIVSALAGFSGFLPPPIGTILQAASVLLPVVEAAVGLLLPGAAPQNPEAVARARLILKGAAAR